MRPIFATLSMNCSSNRTVSQEMPHIEAGGRDCCWKENTERSVHRASHSLEKVLKQCATILSLALLATPSFGGDAIQGHSTENIRDLNADSVNLTAQEFYFTYMSAEAETRAKAELYLLGVMDVTEGRVWCDFRKFKTITLRERVFLDLKEMQEPGARERASSAIEKILSTRYPCGRNQ